MKSLAENRKQNLPRVECQTCKGTGKRHLTQVERDTLASVNCSWTPTRDVLWNIGDDVSRTNIVNRLNNLVDLGLVERRRVGRTIEWRHA